MAGVRRATGGTGGDATSAGTGGAGGPGTISASPAGLHLGGFE